MKRQRMIPLRAPEPEESYFSGSLWGCSQKYISAYYNEKTTMLQLETMTHSVARKQFVKNSVGVAREGTGGPSKETLYECNRRYGTMYYIYVGLQHVKCELVRPYTLQIQGSFVLSVSLPLFLSLYAARPRSDSMVATGGCTGVSCQRHHLHRFVPFVLK